jgi:hypothetical protein
MLTIQLNKVDHHKDLVTASKKHVKVDMGVRKTQILLAKTKLQEVEMLVKKLLVSERLTIRTGM